MPAPTTLGGAGMAAAGSFPVGGSLDPLKAGTLLLLGDRDLAVDDRFRAESLELSDAIGAGDALGFVHQVLAGGEHLKVGQRIILRQDTVNIFFGTIDRLEEVKVGGSGDALFTRVEAVDLTKILEHRLVTAAEAYTSQTAGFIVNDLVAKYLTNDGITTNSVQTGPTLSSFSVKAFTKVSKALKDLGDRTAFIMFVDAGADLHFEAQTAASAPFNVGGDENSANGPPLLDSGTAQAGSANTLTLRAGAPARLPAKSVLRLPTGPGSVQERPVSAYDGGTKVATVSPRWRTNLCLQSELASGWSATNGAVLTPNAETAPDGTQTAATLTSIPAGTNVGVLNGPLTGVNPANKIYTLSCWIAGNGSIGIRLSNNVDESRTQQVTATATIQRVNVTFSAFNATAGNLFPVLVTLPGDTATSVTLWGFQIEEAVTLGDYIKTEASAITLPDATTGYEVRNADEVPLDDVSVTQTREKYRNKQTIRYGSDLSLSVTRDDLAEQDARKAVEGTSGIYHVVQDEREITTAGEATDLADALLRRFKIPTSTRFSTRRRGLRAGQSITLTFPEHVVSGVHLIDRVVARDDGTDQLRWEVTALSGEHLGDVMEFWRRLADQED